MGTENAFDAEQFLALGAAGIAVLLLGGVVIFAIMGGALQLSIRWIGNRTPSYWACLGWIFAIMFLNLFLISTSLSVLGPAGSLLATPLTWGVTIYMLASAGDCGLLRGFGIWIAQSFLSGIGIFFVVLVMSIPFAMLGAGMQTVEGNLQAQFDEIDQLLAEAEGFSEGGSDAPESTPVGFQVEETSNPWLSDDQVRPTDPAGSEPTSSETTNAPPATVRVDQQEAAPTPRPSRQPKSPPKPRRAADGSVLNPFFNQ